MNSKCQEKIDEKKAYIIKLSELCDEKIREQAFLSQKLDS